MSISHFDGIYTSVFKILVHCLRSTLNFAAKISELINSLLEIETASFLLTDGKFEIIISVMNQIIFPFF